MDCQQIKELLDAYALGALEKDGARHLEEHVADCLRCWNELNEVQQASALLALAVPLQKADPSLRERILRQAHRKGRPARRAGWPLRLRSLWPAAGAALGAATVAALVLSLILRAQVNDLQGDRDQLQQQVEAAEEVISHQRYVLAVLLAPDMRKVEMKAAAWAPEATGTYLWSNSRRAGAIICENLPLLEENQVYQLWLFRGEWATSGGTLTAWKGSGQHVVELEKQPAQPLTAVGVSVEPEGGSATPTSEFILFASFPAD